MNPRREWAETYLTRATGPVPIYGSPEWLALPDGPEKVAAVVQAAEEWHLETRLAELQERAEAEWQDARAKEAEDGAWSAARDAHRRAFNGKAGRFIRSPQIAAAVEQDWRDWVGGEVA